MPVPSFQNVGEKVTVEQLSDFIYGHIRRLNDFLANLDTLNVQELNADVINAGTILAQLVTIMAGLSGGAFIRIDGDGMTINDGTNDVFTVDINGFVTLTGALFQTSASSYPRASIDPTTTLIKAEQSSTSRVEVAASHSGSSPALLIYQGVGLKLQLQEIAGSAVLMSTLNGDSLQFFSSDDLIMSSTADLIMNPTGNLLINGDPGWSGTYSDGINTITVVKGIITNVV